jgi:hypothetical protein
MVFTIVLLIVSVSFGDAAQTPTQVNSFGTWCISHKTGIPRVVKSSQPCKKGEIRIKHNLLRGPQGPAGPQGLQGAPGPVGPAGAPGLGNATIVVCANSQGALSLKCKPNDQIYTFVYEKMP